MGGSASEWSSEIEAGVVANSEIELHIVVTKFGGDPTTLAYEVVIESPASAD